VGTELCGLTGVEPSKWNLLGWGLLKFPIKQMFTSDIPMKTTRYNNEMNE